MALRSGTYDITTLIGEDVIKDFTLYEDDEQTQPYDLTGATVTIVLTPPDLTGAAPITLTTSSGLSIPTPTDGTVTMTHNTTGWNVGRGRWYMELVDAAGDTSYPLRGALYVGKP